MPLLLRVLRLSGNRETGAMVRHQDRMLALAGGALYELSATTDVAAPVSGSDS